MTANLVIFLGILYTLLHFIALLGLLRGYHLPGLGLIIALSVLALGYGIRYGSRACLYAATAVFAVLSLCFGALLVSAWRPYYLLRLGLSVWTLWRLYRALPLMRLLQQQRAFPLPMSRYGERFLHRFRAQSGQRSDT
jgi:hypothetical protein